MQWSAIEEASRRQGTTPYHIFQEEAQKTILTGLSRAKAFTNIVFQGGTALRLFYGNPRFSDDLDFVLRDAHQRFDLTTPAPDITRFLQESYPFITSASYQFQKHDDLLQRCVCLIETSTLPRKLRVHLELAAVPSYQHQPRILDFPPLSPAVEVETAEEILADKIVAFGLRPYLKGRDLWDVSYLLKERHLKVPWPLVYRKAEDYGTRQNAFHAQLQQRAPLIISTGVHILSHELSRFLSASLREHYEPTYPTMAADVARLLTEAPKPLGGDR
jgi:predicted nucleotidyltransferase component of viral defense system